MRRIARQERGQCMTMLDLSKAARLVGRDVSTLHRAMASGRLSFTKDRAGKRQLDPAELERVFGIKGITTFRGNDADPDRNAPQAETIRHLRRLLEIEVAERRRMLALLTGPRAPWWRRWFR